MRKPRDFDAELQALTDKANVFKYDAVVLNNTTLLKAKANPALVPNLIEFVKSYLQGLGVESTIIPDGTGSKATTKPALTTMTRAAPQRSRARPADRTIAGPPPSTLGTR